MIDLASRAARTDAAVLITGETGTGKELLAKAIHFNSARREQPFVIVNCGSIPRDLVESELFGHVKGAFTGAVTHKQGRAEMADGGTLFLDEIGEMPPEMQVRLLRLVQEGEVQKIGATNAIRVDVRIIAATHRNLERTDREWRSSARISTIVWQWFRSNFRPCASAWRTFLNSCSTSLRRARKSIIARICGFQRP